MTKNTVIKIFEGIGFFFAMFLIIVLAFIGYRQWRVAQLPERLEKVKNGDAILGDAKTDQSFYPHIN